MLMQQVPVLGEASTLRDALLAGDADLVRQVIDHPKNGDSWRIVVRQLLVRLLVGGEEELAQLQSVMTNFGYLADEEMVRHACYEAAWELGRAFDKILPKLPIELPTDFAVA